MLARLLTPITRRMVYPGAGTRISADDTTYAVSVAGAELRGWVVNPGQARALVYFGGNGEGLGGCGPSSSGGSRTTRATSSPIAGTARATAVRANGP